MNAPAQIMMLYITEDCNLRCTYCFVEKSAKTMSLEIAKKSIDFLLSRNISGVERDVYISFFGGEPFLELDLLERIVEYVQLQSRLLRKRAHFSATTNGTIFSERVEKLIRSTGMSLLVSLDGDRAASRYRPLLSGRDSYSRVARNIGHLAACASEMHARVTFHPGSLDLKASVIHALELGAPSVALCPVVEANWREMEDALERSYSELADWYIDVARTGVVPPLTVTNLMLLQHHESLHGAPRPKRCCDIGTRLFGVNVDGKIMPCHRFLHRPHTSLGHVTDKTFSEERRKYVTLASADILGCDSCIARFTCGGGCRVVALEAGLDLTDRHPAHCLLTRAHMRAVTRIYETLLHERNAGLAALLSQSRVPDPSMTELTTR
jgi:uncharacterized protein